AIGYGVFEHYHAFHEIKIENAKVTGTMVSVRTLVNGRVSEFLFQDGDEVKAGDVIARLEISVTEEMIEQLESTVELARQNYEELQRGTWVKVPVTRTRAVQTPVYTESSRTSGGGSANLASLEERANRMRELFEMGAVSAVQRDAAIQAYENAKANSSSYTYSESGVRYETTYVEEIEYVDELQPTPPAVLYGAENAIKQAELSLNVALQEAQETAIIAPVDGTIYYSTEPQKDLKAGDVVAKIGDSNELWLAAEVSEETFNKIPLGKLVSYSIDGNNLTGTVIEKISPEPAPAEVTEPAAENLPTENAATESAPTETPAATENSPAVTDTPPVENATTPATEPAPTDVPAPAENQSALLKLFSVAYAEEVTEPAATPAEPATAEPSAEIQSTEPASAETPAESQPAAEKATESAPFENATPHVSENQTDAPPRNDKFILRVSLPNERNFECRPNTTTTLRIRI
ncbi:MAG: HlyD family efflux transporter periplasmic adaptor subunit, partial [Selenomonadaceae bacterium]|nr:HlyD family efflux transporter periplasmic adaptor subunit [Selenomonadaceae bacterium]